MSTNVDISLDPFPVDILRNMMLITTILLSIHLTTHLISCQSTRDQPNEVTFVDTQLNDNLVRHHTIKYKLNGRYNDPFNRDRTSAVLRRGEQFRITINLRHNYNADLDKFRIEFSLGPQPQLDKGTLIYLPLEELNSNSLTRDQNKWGAQLLEASGNKLSVNIDLPPDMAIGVWRLRISTKLAGTRNLRSYALNDAFYVIFNAWNKEDQVFMPREDGRQEFVLNEVGKIYIGSYSRPTGRKWTYGQFHTSVLSAVMYMLDKSRLDVNDRADVVKVSRYVSALVNSHDDNGLLVGNWSGNYGDGLAPWQWTGSPAIFDRFLNNGARSVKFGQCWVFGGVTTTALRTLGIPARTISNFVSAHDTDFSLTVDKFYTERGQEISGINGDSIWNFHVWSDAWMARYDLPPDYGGWQAIDATPQETSMGFYQLGPASLEAIKQGKVGFAYDVGFVYSEVNADLVHWRLDGRTRTQWRRNKVDTAHVGRKILTKMIGFLDERSVYGVGDAEDIVRQYKHIEGSIEERNSYHEAAKSGGLAPLYNNL